MPELPNILDELLGIPTVAVGGTAVTPRRTTLDFAAGLDTEIAGESDPDTGAVRVTITAAGNGATVRPVRLAATGNVADLALASPTVDGETAVDGDRILLPFQSDPTEIGAYVAAIIVGGPNDGLMTLTRAADMPAGAVLPSGLSVAVQAGATYAGAKFTFFGDGSVTVGTSSPVLSWGAQVDVCPHDRGAIGDNSNDDTTAMQEAIEIARYRGTGLALRRGALYKITNTLNFINVGGTEYVGMRIHGGHGGPAPASSSIAWIVWHGNTTDAMIKAWAPSMSLERFGLRVAAGKATDVGIDWDKGVGGLAGTHLDCERLYVDPLNGTMTYGIRVGARDLSTTNLEYMAVDRCIFTRQTEAGIYIPNTSGQSKLHQITRTSFTYAKSGVRIKSGSARFAHCNFGRLTQCAVEVDRPVDFISLVDTDTEDCTRFLDTFWDGGASTSPWVLKVDGLRAGITENLAGDGRYMRVTHPGVLDLRSMQFEYNVSANDLDPDSVKIAIWSSVDATISSRGNLYLNKNPWSKGAGTNLWVSSENDWAKTFTEAPPGTWSASGYERMPRRSHGAREDGTRGVAANGSIFTAATLELPDDCACVVTAIISASKAGTGKESWVLTAAFENTAGTCTLVGPPADGSQATLHQPASLAWDAILDASGGAVRARLTLAADVYWTVSWQIAGLESQTADP